MRTDSNQITLKDALTEMLKAYRMEAKINSVRIKDIWEKQMGLGVSKYTTMISLKNDTLYIQLSSAPLKNELLYAQEKIMGILNKELGGQVISKIVIL